jgi:hypothetical protein
MELLLNQNKVVLFDDADWPLVSQHHWSAGKTGTVGLWYAKTKTCDANGNRKTVTMHRMILAAKPGQLTDHRNGNGLDNRRENIRLTDYSGNNRNRRRDEHKEFKGTYRNKWGSARLWEARIRITKEKRLIIRGFKTEIEAARAYDQLAKEHHGEFARLNFPESELAAE